jgi:hypothetical protein
MTMVRNQNVRHSTSDEFLASTHHQAATADGVGATASHPKLVNDGNSKRRNAVSHPVGRGSAFIHMAFNINGHSPLIAHVLATMNIESSSGPHVLVERIEVENLLPLDAPTYRDVIRKSYRTIKESEQAYDRCYRKFTRDCARFTCKFQQDHRRYMEKEAALLSRPRDVHLLSDLIVRELKSGNATFSKAAQQTIEASLEAAQTSKSSASCSCRRAPTSNCRSVSTDD